MSQHMPPSTLAKTDNGLVKPKYFTVAEGTMWQPWCGGAIYLSDLVAAVNKDYSNKRSPRFRVNATFKNNVVHSFLFTELGEMPQQRWDVCNGWTDRGKLKP